MQQVTTISDEKVVAARPARMLSLDVFRGITIAGMILVNSPGSWEAIYSPLQHASWHGWTPTDLIFPFFLFIVGVSITLSLSESRQAVTRRRIVFRILRRTAIIFALGIVVHGFPYYHLATIRIPGVLQRIAVCYLAASIVFIKTGWKAQAIISVALLLAYWFVMMIVPVPGYGAGDLSIEGNLAAYLDRLLLPGHLYKPVYDPEGILSTVPAISTTLLGVLCGRWIGSDRQAIEKAAGLFFAGLCGVVIGWAWNGLLPINKALWTSSYVVLTAGMALQFLGFCIWLIDIKGHWRWSKPFVVFGLNSIAVYVLSEMGEIVLNLNVLRLNDSPGSIKSPGSMKGFLHPHLFESWASPKNASLMWALTTIFVWLGVMTLLYRRRIFIKV